MGRDHCKSVNAMSRTLTMCWVTSEKTRGLLPPFTKWTPETVPDGKRQKFYDTVVFPNLFPVRSACSRICRLPINSLFVFVRPLSTGNINNSARYITLSTGDFYDKLYIRISSHLADSVNDHFTSSCHSTSERLSRLIHLNSECQNGQIVLQIGLVCLFRVVVATISPSVMGTVALLLGLDMIFIYCNWDSTRW